MKQTVKKITAILLIASITLTGCGKQKKEPKPEQKKASEVKNGTTKASRTGKGQSDAPFIIGTTSFDEDFNPFSAVSDADRQIVDLTQVKLVSLDRSGFPVYQAINGAYRTYQGNHYTYYGTSDLDVNYNSEKNETSYHITLRNDLFFSDREKITADDVIFTLYALCDNSYTGVRNLKEKNIKGLLNYQADSTRAETLSGKKIRKYVKKQPKILQKFIETNVIQAELTKGLADCRKNYQTAGYETVSSYFVEKYAPPVKDHDILYDEEKLLTETIAYYKKAGYKKLALHAYHDEKYFDAKIERQARIELSRGKGEKVSSIEGIKKLDDYELEIITTGYDRTFTKALSIFICPLHYYGDLTKYNYEAGQFGFTRGDISALQANRAMPMGAGPYRYVKLEDGIAYFTSNESYFLGCPKTAFLQVKEMADILVETKQQIKQKQAEEENNPLTNNDPDISPAPTTNPSEELTELLGGTTDMIGAKFTGKQLPWITGTNSNEEISGSTVESRFYGDGTYYYIGIHAGNVSVAGEPESDRSKALRHAIASVFSASRKFISETEGETVSIPDYPTVSGSFMTPDKSSADYQIAYASDRSGSEIYDEELSAEETMSRVSENALKDFADSGYTIENGKLATAPDGASLNYTLWITGGEKNICYPAVEKATETLNNLGIHIELQTLSGEIELEKKLKTGTQELWISVIRSGEVSLSEKYGETADKNSFGIQNADFYGSVKQSETHMSLEERKTVYKACYDFLLEQAVEVPMCEPCNTLLFSAERIVRKTIPADLTLDYSFTREIQKIEMK